MYIYVYIYIVKSFPACSLTKYKIKINYIIFPQDVPNCFEFFFNFKVTKFCNCPYKKLKIGSH